MDGYKLRLVAELCILMYRIRHRNFQREARKIGYLLGMVINGDLAQQEVRVAISQKHLEFNEKARTFEADVETMFGASPS